MAARALRYFDHRFEEIKQHLREQDAAIQHGIAIAAAPPPPATPDAAALARLQFDLNATAETVAGMAADVDRRLTRFVREQEAVNARSRVEAGNYTEETVQFLNWVLSFDGPIAERSLLVNHPLTVLFDQRGPRLFQVNERIVEIPFALSWLGTLPRGSRVADVGAAESTLALSIASAGHWVTAVDPRGYPFEHPNLSVAAKEVEAWSPAEPLDLVTAVSAIEHFGLGHYQGGSDPADGGGDADVRALDRFRSWLRPGGSVVLTLPTGPATTDDFQRVYDRDRLKRLVDGWEVCEEAHSVQTTPFVWEPSDGPPAEGRGVAMLVLRR